MESISVKRCNRCKAEKPCTREFFHIRTNGRVCAQCKDCANQVRRIGQLPKPAPPPEGFKRCPACLEEKPATLEYFGKQAAKKDGLRSRCRPCAAAWEAEKYTKEQKAAVARRAREKNAEHYREWKRNWRKRTPELQRASEKRYRERHPEQYRIKQRGCQQRARAKDPEKFRQRARAHREANRELYRHYSAKRRELIKSCAVITKAQLRKILKAQGGKCWWCGKDCSSNHHFDHVIPLSKGGSHTLSNLRVTCVTCNTRKNALMPWEFANRLF